MTSTPAAAQRLRDLAWLRRVRDRIDRAAFGFEEDARLDEGTMWATSWALTKLTAADEATIAALVKKAVG